jgi:hypothetical protein
VKTNKILLLALALVVATGISVWLTKNSQVQDVVSLPLLGDFEDQLAVLQTISVRSRDAVEFSAEQVDNQWYATHLSDVDSFPVNTDDLSVFIGQLNQAKLLEAKTQNVNLYARLGVEDLIVENSQSRSLLLQTSNSNFELLIGNDSSNGLGTFVRSPESKQSWQIDRVLNLPSDQFSWLKNPVLDMTADDINRAELQGDEGWVIANQDNDFRLAGLQQTDNLIYPTVLASTLSSIIEIRYERAIPAVSMQLPESVAATLFFESEKGPLTIHLYSVDEQHWVTYAIEQQPWLSNWVFSISESSRSGLVKSRSDFIQQTAVPDSQPQP